MPSCGQIIWSLNTTLDIICFLTGSCATGVSTDTPAEPEELPHMEVDAGMVEGGESESLEDDATLQIEKSRMESDARDVD